VVYYDGISLRDGYLRPHRPEEVADLTAHTAGGAAGLDHRIAPGTVIGFALGGAGTGWSLDQNLGSGRSDVFQAGVYGTTRYGPAYLAAALAYTEHWMSTNRYAFAGDYLTANFNAHSFGGRVKTGYRLPVGLWGLTVGALDLLGPYAAKPGSPVFESARLRIFAAMLYCDTRGVAEQDRVSGLANHLVQAVELLLRGRDEVAERLTKILQLAKGEDTRRPAVEGIDAVSVRGTLPGARQLLDGRHRCLPLRHRIDAFGVPHGRADQAGGAFQPHRHASIGFQRISPKTLTQEEKTE
jgi:hypothetical protein